MQAIEDNKHKIQSSVAAMNRKRTLSAYVYDFLCYCALHIISALFTTLSLAYESSIVTCIGLFTFIYLLKIKHQSIKSQFISQWFLYFIFLWTSSYWLIYCLIDFINISQISAIILLSIAMMVVSAIISLPSMLYHICHKRYEIALSMSCLLILADYVRMHTIIAMPWLFWSNHMVNMSIFHYILPTSGYLITGYLCLRAIEMMVNVLLGRIDKDAIWVIPLIGTLTIITLCSTLLSKSDVKEKNQHTMIVNMMQNNHNHQDIRHAYLDWEDYLHKIHPEKKNTLNISAEGAIRFSADEMSISNFRKMTFLKNSIIGVNYQTGDQFIPLMIGTNEVHGAYHKKNLVPFGEYFPMPNWIMEQFGFYQTHRMATHKEKQSIEPITFKNYKFFPMICYDMFFPIEGGTSHTDAIIVMAENTWYRNSIFQPMFIRAAKLRAIESSKPIFVILNRGPSAHISPKGTIITQAPYNTVASLHSVLTKEQSKYFHGLHIGTSASVMLIIVFEIASRIYWQRRIKKYKRAQNA